jgi:hypothetical protein
MGTATRFLVGAAAALTISGLVPASANAIAPTPTPTPTPTAQPETCRYIVNTKHPIAIKSGPGKNYAKRGELQPSTDPITTTCATRGRGPDHWVQLQSGDFKNLWVWRNWLKPYSE